jgi:hypothetical protein
MQNFNEIDVLAFNETEGLLLCSEKSLTMDFLPSTLSSPVGSFLEASWPLLSTYFSLPQQLCICPADATGFHLIAVEHNKESVWRWATVFTFGCCILLRIYPTGSTWRRRSQQSFNTLTRFYFLSYSLHDGLAGHKTWRTAQTTMKIF